MTSFKSSVIWIVAGSLLVLTGLVLVLFNLQQDSNALESSEAVISELEDVREAEQSIAVSVASEADDELPVYVENPDRAMPIRTINGSDYIGILEARAIGLELPVMAEWNYKRLQVAPCRYTGSVYLNNLIICAHNYKSHFGLIKNLQMGDIVTFTDMDGNLFTYEVAEIETIAPNGIDDMEAGDWDLTLFTCTIGGASRVTVRCVLYDMNSWRN